MPRKPAITDPALAVRLYDAGSGLAAIAARLGVSPAAVRTALLGSGRRLRTRADQVGPGSPRWGSGRSRHQSGYIEVRVSDHPRAGKRKRVFEHILVMEKHLGHYIPRTMSVRHLNGVPDDNRLENLAVVPVATQRDHARSVRGRKITPEIGEKIQRLYESGASAESIAPQVGLNASSILRFLRRSGNPPRSQVAARYKVADSSAVTSLYQQGMSLTAIAAELGISSGAVRNALVRANVDRRSPETYRGERASRWKGGRIKRADGYILIHRPGHPRAGSTGYVREHVLVMEEILGFPVPADMDVHHINGVKDDNRPENLQMLSKAAHATHHAEQRQGRP